MKPPYKCCIGDKCIDICIGMEYNICKRLKDFKKGGYITIHRYKPDGTVDWDDTYQVEKMIWMLKQRSRTAKK